jgi:hypothetical protein
MQAINVSALSMLTAKTLDRTQEETEHVGMGASFTISG